jgi:hypothetical protein
MLPCTVCFVSPTSGVNSASTQAVQRLTVAGYAASAAILLRFLSGPSGATGIKSWKLPYDLGRVEVFSRSHSVCCILLSITLRMLVLYRYRNLWLATVGVPWMPTC